MENMGSKGGKWEEGRNAGTNGRNEYERTKLRKKINFAREDD